MFVIVTFILSIRIIPVTGINYQYVWVGIFLGIISNVFWKYGKLDRYVKGLEFFEHYHWGLLSIGLGSFLDPKIFMGVWILGVSFIVVESFFQSHKFAVGSSHESESDQWGLIFGVASVVLFALGQYII